MILVPPSRTLMFVPFNEAPVPGLTNLTFAPGLKAVPDISTSTFPVFSPVDGLILVMTMLDDPAFPSVDVPGATAKASFVGEGSMVLIWGIEGKVAPPIFSVPVVEAADTNEDTKRTPSISRNPIIFFIGVRCTLQVIKIDLDRKNYNDHRTPVGTGVVILKKLIMVALVPSLFWTTRFQGRATRL